MIGRKVSTRGLQSIGSAALNASSPTLDQEVQRLCLRYGKKEVAAALKKVRSSRVGRPPEPDNPALWDIAQADARDWLDGHDPFKLRTNYSIAIAEADRNPGHNRDATKRRFERKLGKKRRFWMYLAAEQITRTEYSAIKRVEALRTAADDSSFPPFNDWADEVQIKIDDFEQRFPNEIGSKTVQEIEAALRPPVPSGIFDDVLAQYGLLGRKT